MNQKNIHAGWCKILAINKMQYLNERHNDVFPQPSKSPDPTLVDKLRGNLETWLNNRQNQPRDLRERSVALQKEWDDWSCARLNDLKTIKLCMGKIWGYGPTSERHTTKSIASTSKYFIKRKLKSISKDLIYL